MILACFLYSVFFVHHIKAAMDFLLFFQYTQLGPLSGLLHLVFSHLNSSLLPFLLVEGIGVQKGKFRSWYLESRENSKRSLLRYKCGWVSEVECLWEHWSWNPVNTKTRCLSVRLCMYWHLVYPSTQICWPEILNRPVVVPVYLGGLMMWWWWLTFEIWLDSLPSVTTLETYSV